MNAATTQRASQHERTRSIAGFRARTMLDDSPEATAHVKRAIARAKCGDREALRFLYIKYSDNVYGYIRSIVRDDHEAEDVTQHVFAKLMTVLVKYDDRGVPFFAWLLRLARNAAIDHLRSQRSTPCEEVVARSTPTSDEGRERTRSLRTALATLPDEQRDVVILRHVVGLTPVEIAERMGRTESSIHGLHHRGRRSLQQALIDLDAAPSTRSEARMAC